MDNQSDVDYEVNAHEYISSIVSALPSTTPGDVKHRIIDELLAMFPYCNIVCDEEDRADIDKVTLECLEQFGCAEHTH